MNRFQKSDNKRICCIKCKKYRKFKIPKYHDLYDVI